MTDQAMSPLRRRMIEDMTIRKFAPKTQHDYLQRSRTSRSILVCSPDTARSEDVRRYQLHLTASGVGVPTVNQTVSTLRLFFKVTLGRPDLVERTHSSGNRASCRWCSVQRRWRGCWMPAPALKYKAALSVATGLDYASPRWCTEDRRHRQQAHGHSRRARQRPQRPDVMLSRTCSD